ncbi:MAG: hypothetical protein IAE67_06460 [Candidatus Competibacteraceae bacterium]|nr:hypothetical protein [Candidatus Competibacteraceae bacterium]
MKQITSDQFIRLLRLLSIFMAASLLTLAFVFSVLVVMRPPESSELWMLRYIPYFVSFISIPMSVFIFRQTIGKSKGGTLAQKLKMYRTAYIMRLALIEAPGLMAVVFFYITTDWITLIPAFLSAFFLLGRLPSAEKIIDELSLTGEDAEKMLRPDEIVMS